MQSTAYFTNKNLNKFNFDKFENEFLEKKYEVNQTKYPTKNHKKQKKKIAILK